MLYVIILVILKDVPSKAVLLEVLPLLQLDLIILVILKRCPIKISTFRCRSPPPIVRYVQKKKQNSSNNNVGHPKFGPTK